MRKFLLALCLLISLPVFAADEKESVYERVMRTGIIKCGYGVWEPMFMKDPNTGAMSGIFYDYMNELAKNLSLKVEWTEEADWSAFGQSLESGRIDAFCFDIWPTAGRAREVDFTTPILYQVINAYVRADDTRFDDKLSAIDSDKVTISTLDGEMSNTIAKNDFPKAKVLSSPQIVGQTALMDNVTGGKADITFTDGDTAGNYMAKNPGKIRMVKGGEGVRVFGGTSAIKRGEFEFKAMIDTATRELLYDGTIERIIKKYEKYPNSIKRVAKPYESAE